MPLVFSYGSNSTAQLRTRVKKPTLQSTGASVSGFVRIFCLRSGGWGGGGVASLAPSRDGRVFGAVVNLTDEELGRLDAFEGGYTKTPLTATVGGAATPAIAYIANNPAWQVPPREQYLTACYCQLREHFDMSSETIDVRAVLPGTSEPVLLYSWMHPGTHALTLEALCVEVSCARPTPWLMPKTIGEVVDKLAAVGIGSAAQLAHALAAGDDALNARLHAAGMTTFAPETLAIIRAKLGIGGGGAATAAGAEQMSVG